MRKRKRRYSKRKTYLKMAGLLFSILIALTAANSDSLQEKKGITDAFDPNCISPYSGQAYVEVNNNIPFFSEKELEMAESSFYQYSQLDALGRAGTAFACINFDTLPKQDRDDASELSNIYPSGWNQVEYGPEYVETGWLYNRSHLIGWALGGDTKDYNIVTATRYCNATSMVWFEEECLSFVKSYKDDSILYRVTPIYEGSNLECSGLLMECVSVEQERDTTVYGKNLQFCVYIYNIQPGIEINYKTGESRLIEDFKGEYAAADMPMVNNPIF